MFYLGLRCTAMLLSMAVVACIAAVTHKGSLRRDLFRTRSNQCSFCLWQTWCSPKGEHDTEPAWHCFPKCRNSGGQQPATWYNHWVVLSAYVQLGKGCCVTR